MNFVQLDDLPIHDLQDEFDRLLAEQKISWYKIQDQLCLNSTDDDPDNIYLGRGSLIWDWDSLDPSLPNANKLKRKEKIYKESDFNVLCNGFADSLFEDAYRALEKKYVLGRVRIMRSNMKTCLTWHVDQNPRVHYPMKTQEGCMMIIDNEVKHLPQNTWWWTNTLEKHTAVNASKDYRLHLVATILEEK